MPPASRPQTSAGSARGRPQPHTTATPSVLQQRLCRRVGATPLCCLRTGTAGRASSRVFTPDCRGFPEHPNRTLPGLARPVSSCSLLAAAADAAARRRHMAEAEIGACSRAGVRLSEMPISISGWWCASLRLPHRCHLMSPYCARTDRVRAGAQRPPPRHVVRSSPHRGCGHSGSARSVSEGTHPAAKLRQCLIDGVLSRRRCRHRRRRLIRRRLPRRSRG